MFIRSIKEFIRKYPAFALLFAAAELGLCAAFLLVILRQDRALHRIRDSAEKRAEAVFRSECHGMDGILEDETLSDDGKRMLLYGKIQSAAEALCGTGYGEDIKRGVTEALNGISRHLLAMDGALSEEELDVLRLLGEGKSGEACRRAAETGITGRTVSVEAESALPIPHEAAGNEKKRRDTANRLFGVRGVLKETGSSGATYSCKNAYAVIHGEEGYPLEGAYCSREREPRYTTEECTVLAKKFLEDFYPRKIVRRLTEITERDGGDYGEVTFTDGEAWVTVRIGKGSGRVILLQTAGLG